ncbi:MAG: RelA/SpoT domain-containing protein [Oscillospiraceae bacterium]
MNQKDKSIMEEYSNAKHDFVQLGDVVSNLLRDVVKQSGIQVLTIEHRVKEAGSLEGKLALKGDKYRSLSDITDILGARVVCFFADDVDRIAQFIENTFEVDRENSVDKRAQLDPTAFGYLSLHFICSLPFGKGYPDEICGKKFEIQVRSALQHTWSAIFHDVGYKSDFDLPRQVVRDYSRLAGLLELADEKFVYIRDYMANYSKEVKEKIANNQGDELKIDMVSLREYMQHNISMHNLLKELAAICGSEINDTNPQLYIDQLAWLGKTTLGDLHQMLDDNHGTAVQLAKCALEGSELDILSSTVGLRFLCQAELLRGGYSEERVAEFLALSGKSKARAQSGAAALLRRGATLRGEQK